MIFPCSTHMLMKCWINVSSYQTGWCYTCSSQLNFISLQSDFLDQNVHWLPATCSKLHPNAYGLLQNVVYQIENLEQNSLCLSTLSIRYPSCTSRLFVSFVQYHFYRQSHEVWYGQKSSHKNQVRVLNLIDCVFKNG